LRQILENVVCLIAPVAPFLAEDLYQRIRKENSPESVHLLDFPKADKSLIDIELERKMDVAQKIVFLSRSLREKSKIRVRQPLSRILVPVMTPRDRRDIQHFEDIIKEEINVKTIEFVSGDTDIVRKSVKPNFKTIGKKFGKITQQVANEIKKLSVNQIIQLEKLNTLTLSVDGTEINLVSEDVEIVSEDLEGWLVASEDNITVALDTQLDEELIREGIAREFVNRIQNIRKNSGFDVTDRINIIFSSPENIMLALNAQKDYIMNETLAQELTFNSNVKGDIIELENAKLEVSILRV
jgi:isoleucyl-tRNA synthetase